MLDWMKRRRPVAPNQADTDAESALRRGCILSGRYLLLYKYLQNRYANTVVLTFAEIEDLLGFTLPAPARLRHEWWTDAAPNGARASYSHAWTLASRTATPNLLARTVVFERATERPG